LFYIWIKEIAVWGKAPHRYFLTGKGGSSLQIIKLEIFKGDR
jgi:hypothetical protein